jgi:hypothetical protein
VGEPAAGEGAVTPERLAEITSAAAEYNGTLLVRKRPNSAIAHRGELLAHVRELTAERDAAAFGAEEALTKRIVARLLRIANAIGDVNPQMRDGLLLAAGEAKVERLHEPDETTARSACGHG